MNLDPSSIPPIPMKYHPRALLRFSLFFVHACVMYGLFRARCRFNRNNPALCIAIREKMFTAWAGRTLHILGVELQIEGTRPPPPALIASNHLGYLDILILIALQPTRFLSKIEVAGWPVLGPMVKDMGTLFIDRNNRRDIPAVVNRMKEVLESKESVVFFPEGTSHNMTEVLPLRSPLLKLPVDQQLDLYPVGIQYETKHPDFVASRDVCWWGNTPFMSHFYRFCGIPKIFATVRFGEPVPPGNNRKELAKKLHQALEKLTE